MSELKQTQNIEVQADGSAEPIMSSVKVTDPAKIAAAKDRLLVRLSLEELKAEKADLLFPETADQFLTKVVNDYAYDAAEKEMQLELAKAAIEMGADSSEILNSEYMNIHLLDGLRPYILKNENAQKYLIKVLRRLEEFQSNYFIYQQQEYICIRDHDLKNHVKQIATEILEEYSDYISKDEVQKIMLIESPDASLMLAEEFGWEIDCEFILNLLDDNNEGYQGESAIRTGSYFRTNPEKLLEFKYKNLKAPDTGERKIPHIIHHIWITSPDNPRQIREQDIENVKKTNGLLKASEAHDWQQIIWTNDKSILAPSIEALKEVDVEIKEFSEIKEFLPNYDLVVDHAEQKHWGIASDTLRYDLVHYMGGVYADINYVFERTPDDESVRYNFFSTTYSLDYSFSIDNFMFGASLGHPIMKTAQETVRKNLLEPNLALQPLRNSSISAFTDKATADPIGYSYFQAAHQNGNIDVVYPLPKDNIDYMLYESDREEFKEFTKFCPKFAEFFESLEREGGAFKEYIKLHEICPIDEYLIGHDGENGCTWVEE